MSPLNQPVEEPATLDVLQAIYDRQDRWTRALENARRRKAAAERRIDQAHRHLGITVVVNEIATALTPRFPQHALNVLGPFGLTNETSIHAVDIASEKTQGSLTFRPTDGRRLVLVDRRHVTERFPAGSLGEVNGTNYAEVDLPEDGIDGLTRLLVASIDEGVARERAEARRLCQRRRDRNRKRNRGKNQTPGT